MIEFFKNLNNPISEYYWRNLDCICTVRGWYNCTKYGIQNLIIWFKIIWEDRDWDYAFLLELMQFKLKKMERFFKSDDVNIEKADEVADEIKECIRLIDNVLNEKYQEELYEEFNKKWGEIEHKIVPGKLNQYQLTHKNVKTEEDEEQCHKELNELFKTAELRTQRDLRLIGEILQNNLRGWWD